MNYPPEIEVSNRGTDDQGTQNYEVQEYANRQKRSTEIGLCPRHSLFRVHLFYCSIFGPRAEVLNPDF